MAFHRSPGRRGGSAPSGKTGRPSNPLEDDRRRLEDHLEEIKRRQAEIQRLHEEKERQIKDLPRRIAEQEQKRNEKRRFDQISKVGRDASLGSRGGRRATRIQSVAQGRMTSTEQRAARLQFLMLCAILGIILFLLWKSLP